MKLFTFTALTVVTLLIVATPKAINLFGHVAAERDRWLHAEQQIAQKQQGDYPLKTSKDVGSL